MDLRALYQEVIVDHNRSPRNFRRIEHPDKQLEGFNPLCGDRLTVYLKTNGETIDDVAFEDDRFSRVQHVITPSSRARARHAARRPVCATRASRT